MYRSNALLFLTLLIFPCLFTHTNSVGDEYNLRNRQKITLKTTSQCNLDMFKGDLNAYLACLTEFALQSNWFPSPISGLYSYLDWNSFDGFWQNGAVLETLANFAHYISMI